MRQMQSIFYNKYEIPYFGEVKKSVPVHRYKQLLDALEFKSYNAFEIAIGVAPSTIRKAVDRNSDITGEVVTKIIDKYPNVNTEWLLTGYGSMFKNKVSESGVGEMVVEYDTSKGVASFIMNGIKNWADIIGLTGNADDTILMGNILKLVEERAEKKKQEKDKKK